MFSVLSVLTVAVFGFGVILLVSLAYTLGEKWGRVLDLQVNDWTLHRVDDVIRRAVRIAEYTYNDPDADISQICDKMDEKAVAITNDVLLQQGFDLKDWNVPGLVHCERQRLGIYSRKGDEEKNG